MVPAKRLMSIDEYKEKLINNKNIFDLNAFEKNRRNELIRVLMEE